MSALNGDERDERDWLSILALGLVGLLYLPSYLAALLPALEQRLDLWPLLQGPAAIALLLLPLLAGLVKRAQVVRGGHLRFARLVPAGVNVLRQ